MSANINPTNQIQIGPLISRGWQLFTEDAAKHVGFLAVVALLPSLFFPGNLWSIVTLVIPILEGNYLYVLIRAKGQTPRFADAFLIFNRALPLLLARWAILVLIGLGISLMVIPGIYLSIAYLLVVPFVLDRNTRVWQSLEQSRTIITRQWFRAFLLMVVVSVINLIGMIPFGFGLLITVPLTTCIVVALYETLVGIEGDFPYEENDERARSTP